MKMREKRVSEVMEKGGRDIRGEGRVKRDGRLFNRNDDTRMVVQERSQRDCEEMEKEVVLV